MDSDDEYLRVVELIKGEFSVEEDLLVIEGLEIRKQAWEDVARNYIKKKQQYNKILMYNKEPQAEQFHTHLQQMKTNNPHSNEGKRFHYLKRYCIQREPEKKEIVLEKTKLRKWLQEHPVGTRQSQKLGTTKLELVLLGKNFPKSSIHAYKKPLTEMSDVIKTISDNTEENVITLSEKVSKYSNFDNFNHFHPDIVSRFVFFCVNDVYSQQYESALELQHEEFIKKMEEFKNDYHLTLDANERAHLRVLSQQKREEQQKEWAHWDAITPLAAFLNSTPSSSLSFSSSPDSNSRLSRHSPNPVSSFSSSSRSPTLTRNKNNNSKPNLNKSKGNNNNNTTNNKKTNMQTSSSDGYTTRSVKSERFGDLSYTPLPVHSSSTASVDMREISTRNRKLQAQKFSKMKNIIQQHYKQQKDTVNEIVSVLILRHNQKMDDKKTESIQLYNYIFNKKQVVQLLILAEDLICEDLRQLCILTIASSIDVHINSAQLRCMLLREETYISILSRLPISTLMNIVPGSSIPSSIVSRELSYRKLLVKDEVSNMTFDQLQNISDLYDASSDNDYPSEILPFISMIDIVKNDLAFRRDTYPIVKLENENLPEGIEVNEDRLTISAINQKRYCVARASHAKVCKNDNDNEKAGKWYFEVSIVDVDSLCDASISIGWDVPRPSSEKSVPGLHSGFESKHGCCIQIDGIVHHNGKGEYFGPKASYRQGDVIGCAIDQINLFIHFYKNGFKISSKANHGNFPIQVPYEYVPCVSFYTRQEAKVKFNFSGPFVALPAGYKSYGRAPTLIAR